MVITLTQRQAELTERLRTLLFVEPSTRERSMFGCLSFMVRDKMVVAALKDGDGLSFWLTTALDHNRSLVER